MLVGIPGAGKSTAGRRAAELLGVPFVDLDDEIESAAGVAIPAIFSGRGEAGFRALEAEVSARVAGELAGGVVAAGGGWMANEAAVAPFGRRARIIHLRLPPAVALARLGPEVAARPLLAGSDPAGALQALLRQREEAYSRADAELDVERIAVEEVARRLAELARNPLGTVG